ncbi:MAG: hypothetical protein ACK40M_04410 [Flavobacteriales bacterium]
MKTRRLPHAVLMYREGIIIVEFQDNKDIDIKEAREQIAACLHLSENIPSPVIIIDVHPNTIVSPAAREIFSKEVPPGARISEAIVITNLAKRLIANFYSRYNRPKNPIKVFANFNDAWKWSIEQRDNYKAEHP